MLLINITQYFNVQLQCKLKYNKKQTYQRDVIVFFF